MQCSVGDKVFTAPHPLAYSTSIQAIKYIYKYIYKGSDQATAQVDHSNYNEIKQYLQESYIVPTFAVWLFFEFETHEKSPPLIHFALHLPGEQDVYLKQMFL